MMTFALKGNMSELQQIVLIQKRDLQAVPQLWESKLGNVA